MAPCPVCKSRMSPNSPTLSCASAPRPRTSPSRSTCAPGLSRMHASQPWMRSLTGQVAAPAVQYHWKPRYRGSTPSAIVVEASVVGAAHDGDPARNRLRVERLTAPERVDLETASVWRRQVGEGVMDPLRAALAL